MDNQSFKALLRDGIAAQGDLLIVRCSKFNPDEVEVHWEKVISLTGTYEVAHSETGHHHVLQASGMSPPPVLFQNTSAKSSEVMRKVRVEEGSTAEIVHLRDIHTHGTIVLPPGEWYLLRQKRPTPRGWEIVTD